MYGMGLPDDILRKVYYKNALRIIPNIDKTLFPNDWFGKGAAKLKIDYWELGIEHLISLDFKIFNNQ